MTDNRVFLGFLAAMLLLAGVFAFPRVHAEASNYSTTIGYVLVSEGGSHYTNHPADPGGPTKWGITIHDVRRYLNPNATAQTVKNLTKEQALAIYRVHYADAIQFDRLPRGVDYTVLDYSINAGIGRAAGDLSRVLKLPVEGKVTNLMVVASRILDPLAIIAALDKRRLDFQMGLGDRYKPFKRGWRNRIKATDELALGMAGKTHKSFIRDIMIPQIGVGKAYEEEIADGPV